MNDSWVDRSLYPFAPHVLSVDGGRMHYADQGQGEPIVFVHGTPSWSFIYRELIADLSRDHRCVAPDNIGFGLSDKPPAWGYRFADHARNLATLIDQLDLRNVTLVVHDLGGPIGLSYALAHPERVRRLVLFNTLLWPMQGEFAAPAAVKLFGGPIGRFLYLRMNASARSLVPMVYGERSRLTPAIHRQFVAPFPTPADRHGMFAFARQMAAGAPDLAPLWAERAALANLPALLIWGMKDPVFGQRFLGRWRELLPQARVVELPDVGHFVSDEAPAQSIAAIRSFLAADQPDLVGHHTEDAG